MPITHLLLSLICRWSSLRLEGILVIFVGVSTVRAVHGQHQEWATLGFIRAIASNATICRCLIDKCWLHTLLTMIDVPAAVPADEDNDDRDAAARVQHLSLPKRVIC